MSLLHPAVDAEIIARGTVGFSGAELENLVNQAALKAAVDGKDMVTLKDLEFAKDKILMGECCAVSPLLHSHKRSLRPLPRPLQIQSPIPRLPLFLRVMRVSLKSQQLLV